MPGGRQAGATLREWGHPSPGAWFRRHLQGRRTSLATSAWEAANGTKNVQSRQRLLLDLGFPEHDVLAYNWVVFL
jgi:hypothetical protein